MRTRELERAVKRARKTLPRVATDKTGAGMVCPGCGNYLIANYSGPAAGRLNAILVVYATHMIMECQ